MPYKTRDGLPTGMCARLDGIAQEVKEIMDKYKHSYFTMAKFKCFDNTYFTTESTNARVKGIFDSTVIYDDGKIPLETEHGVGLCRRVAKICEELRDMIERYNLFSIHLFRFAGRVIFMVRFHDDDYTYEYYQDIKFD